jgi:transposase
VLDHGWWLELEVELAVRAGCCRFCGRGSVTVKDRDVVRVRDLPIAGRLTYLSWRKRRYRCDGCERTFTETHPQLPSRQRVSARFRARLFERCRGGGAHAEVAREEQTTRYQVQRAFCAGVVDELDRRRLERPARRISLDEAHHRRRHELATVVSDLDRRSVIDVIVGRDQRTIERYLRSLPPERKAAIEIVSIDPYEAYRQAVWAELPGVRIVCDPFHLVRGAGEALDTVRRQLQRGQISRRRSSRKDQRSSWRQDLFRARHLLLRASERLTSRERRRLCEIFEREPTLAEAWGLKEAFRSIYHATSRTEAEQRLDALLAAVDRSALPSFEAFAKGIRLWRHELLAYFDEPTTNGYAEGITNKIKLIKRRAYGLPTFTGFRQRVLLACS